jgi:hypothetical protein
MHWTPRDGLHVATSPPASSPKWRGGARAVRTVTSPTDYETVLWLPLWPAIMLFAIPAVWLWIIGRRGPPGACRKCGYDMTGNTSGVCPECGAGVRRGLLRT